MPVPALKAIEFMQEIQIVPSKPFKNYEEITFLAAPAAGRVERIQVDICDGEFVKNISWPFTETSKVDFARLKDKPELDVFMPQWEELNYTADLMCLNPEKYIETLVAYGFDEIIVHFRSLTPPPDSFPTSLIPLAGEEQAPQDLGLEGPGSLPAKGGLGRVLEMCEKYDLKLYLAVDMKVNFSEFDHILQGLLKIRSSNFAGVQVMGIENIGFQGQEFAPETLELVKKVKDVFKNFPKLKILFDGGISDENLLEIKNAGVDVFCIGHLLTDGDFVDNLRFIKKIINN